MRKERLRLNLIFGEKRRAGEGRHKKGRVFRLEKGVSRFEEKQKKKEKKNKERRKTKKEKKHILRGRRREKSEKKGKKRKCLAKEGSSS